MTDADLDDGGIRDDRVAAWVTAARSAYLDRCQALRAAKERSGLELRERDTRLPPGAALGRPELVAVTAGVTEVRPSSFTILVRLRALGGERDVALNATSLLRLENPETGEPSELGKEIRDEFIALAHAAEHFN